MKMKHPPTRQEVFEFNIGQAPQLRCTSSSDKTPSCEQCESCRLRLVLDHVQQWISRAGDQSRRRFLLGLVRRVNSVDILNNISNLLLPLCAKDSVYARSRLRPALTTDVMRATGDRCLDSEDLEALSQDVFSWFQTSNYWTKSNFLLSVMHICEAHQLHAALKLSRILLDSETRTKSPTFTDYEASSLVSDDLPSDQELEDLDLLQTTAVTTSSVGFSSEHESRPVSAPVIRQSVVLDPDPQEVHDDRDSMSWVTPSSDKASSGVAAKVDFIRLLPIHLGKYIINMLDEKTVKGVLKVSRHWKSVADEVLQESIVNQQIREEVLIMQGASANSVNPVFAADTDVPVPNLEEGTLDVKFLGEIVCQFQDGHLYKTECTYEAAYKGVSTRNVIMEERNIFCGPYNVLVLKTQEDNQRVTHTDGGRLLAIGSNDRKVRFLDVVAGMDTGPVIHGHAGSIRALFLCTKRGFVLSCSYDTSIRRWDIHTGQCMKIYRGHTGSVTCIYAYQEQFITGATDRTCKIWGFESRKCWRTLKHVRAVTSVTMSDIFAVTGDAGGAVNVWDVRNGQHIKSLVGHVREITSLKFDRWHITSTSRDGFALVWSAIGKFSACLAALRHPKAVLCSEFLYMRVLTGAEDGRVRIWNILNGQCCRIMRGNSRSDPILHLTAIGNRIIVNTRHNVLALNFEPIKWDYALVDDQVPPLIQYSHFSDAPVRSQSHSYVRAQRLRLAGAADPRLRREAAVRGRTLEYEGLDGRITGMRQPMCTGPVARRAASALSLRAASRATAVSFKDEEEQESESEKLIKFEEDEVGDLQTGVVDVQPHSRRVSWGFERPPVAPCTAASLSEMKGLLRSQLRAPIKSKASVAPEFLRRTATALREQQTPQTEAAREVRHQLALLQASEGAEKTKSRPSSGPSRVDPRERIMPSQMGWEALLQTPGEQEEDSDDLDEKEFAQAPTRPVTPARQILSTSFSELSVRPVSSRSRYPSSVRTTIPPAKIMRPHSAVVARPRPKSASAAEQTVSGPGFISSGGVGLPVPMLMYPQGMKENIRLKRELLQAQKREKDRQQKPAGATPAFGVQCELVLRTHQQDEEHLKRVEQAFQDDIQRQQKLEEAKRRRRWLAMVSNRPQRPAVPQATAPVNRVKQRPKTAT